MRIVRDIMDSIQEVLGVNGSLTDEQRKNLVDAREILSCIEEYELLETRLAVTAGVYEYYVRTRAVGHTRVLRQGIEEANKPKDGFDVSTKLYVVIGANREAQSFPDFQTVTLDDFRAGNMKSRTAPLAWDNNAIIRLVSGLSIVQGTFRRIRHIVEETTGNGD